MPPEYLAVDEKGNVPAPVFSPKSDVYSFGGIMLQVLEGKVPYHYISGGYLTLLALILRGRRPERPLAPVIRDGDWNFIQSCWLEDMGRRPSDEDIVEFVEGRARIQS
ncbi:hypothetical protein EV424DRAFT_199942 [Suillus variegatus]|nr:hypothetical protein EV424DRAFT_199942 [Suillus variegatus]